MKSFVDIYSQVSEERVEALLEFRSSHPFQHIRLNDVEWDYLSCGSGDQAVLILGGGGSRGDSPMNTINRLEERYRLISPSYPPVQRVETVIEGLAELLQAEGITKAHVYGHSLGSGIAHALVRRCPDLVDKLVLGSFGLYTPANTKKSARAIRWMARAPYGFIRAIYQSRMSRSLEGLEPDDAAFLRASFEELFTLQHTKESFIGQLNLLVDLIEHAQAYDLRMEVERSGKVLLLFADDDRGFTREEQDALVATYPGACVERFSSGGHLIQYTRREKYAQVMDEFLTGNIDPFTAV